MQTTCTKFASLQYTGLRVLNGVSLAAQCQQGRILLSAIARLKEEKSKASRENLAVLRQPCADSALGSPSGSLQSTAAQVTPQHAIP